MFLVKVFTEGKKVVGKAFLPKKRFLCENLCNLWFHINNSNFISHAIKTENHIINHDQKYSISYIDVR